MEPSNRRPVGRGRAGYEVANADENAVARDGRRTLSVLRSPVRREAEVRDENPCDGPAPLETRVHRPGSVQRHRNAKHAVRDAAGSHTIRFRQRQRGRGVRRPASSTGGEMPRQRRPDERSDDRGDEDQAPSAMRPAAVLPVDGSGVEHLAGLRNSEGARSVHSQAAGLANVISPNIWRLPVAQLQTSGRTQIELAASAGGDTDSNAAVAGALIGAGCDRDGIPERWLASLKDRERIERAASGLVA
jgi:hypothetical protein